VLLLGTVDENPRQALALAVSFVDTPERPLIGLPTGWPAQRISALGAHFRSGTPYAAILEPKLRPQGDIVYMLPAPGELFPLLRRMVPKPLASFVVQAETGAILYGCQSADSGTDASDWFDAEGIERVHGVQSVLSWMSSGPLLVQLKDRFEVRHGDRAAQVDPGFAPSSLAFMTVRVYEGAFHLAAAKKQMNPGDKFDHGQLWRISRDGTPGLEGVYAPLPAGFEESIKGATSPDLLSGITPNHVALDSKGRLVQHFWKANRDFASSIVRSELVPGVSTVVLETTELPQDYKSTPARLHVLPTTLLAPP
jgi:hypothetical protein